MTIYKDEVWTDNSWRCMCTVCVWITGQTRCCRLSTSILQRRQKSITASYTFYKVLTLCPIISFLFNFTLKTLLLSSLTSYIARRWKHVISKMAGSDVTNYRDVSCITRFRLNAMRMCGYTQLFRVLKLQSSLDI